MPQNCRDVPADVANVAFVGSNGEDGEPSASDASLSESPTSWKLTARAGFFGGGLALHLLPPLLLLRRLLRLHWQAVGVPLYDFARFESCIDGLHELDGDLQQGCMAQDGLKRGAVQRMVRLFAAGVLPPLDELLQVRPRPQLVNLVLCLVDQLLELCVRRLVDQMLVDCLQIEQVSLP